ncbi:MAG: hypothetical protein GTN68_20445 [Candidatus Aminicenantes bacterium]|nr:hypothetical protein [Candidatus Aminicenantes bacterium]
MIEIEKTCDFKQHPQRTFAVRKNLDSKPGQSPHCIFVVVCPEWTELEHLDDIDAARKELLADNIKETKVQTVKDWGKVTIKLCLRRPGGRFLKKLPPWTPRKNFSIRSTKR